MEIFSFPLLITALMRAYRFLSNAGIDSVKTDAQFMVDAFDDADDRRRFIKAYQDAWMISNLRFFSAKAISCSSA